MCGTETDTGFNAHNCHPCAWVWCRECGQSYVAACHVAAPAARVCCEQAFLLRGRDLPPFLWKHSHGVGPRAWDVSTCDPDKHVSVLLFWCMRLTVLVTNEDALAVCAGFWDKACKFWDNFHDNRDLPQLPGPQLAFDKADGRDGIVGTCCGCGREHRAVLDADQGGGSSA